MRTLLLIYLLICSVVAQAVNISPQDSAVFERFWKYAEDNNLKSLPVSARVPVIGSFFLNTPYIGGTLNGAENKESPVIDLSGLDCVTFVETVIALSFLNHYNSSSIEDFIRNIVKIRYRNGKIIDYTSRLHYSSDWLHDMNKRSIVKNITPKDVVYKDKVYYMTTHPESYSALKSSPALQKKMKKIENENNARKHFYIPKNKLEKYDYLIKSGDIILITTNLKGLDTSHVGIAYRKNGKLFLMHASSREKKVVISSETLENYLLRNSTQTGIMVGRLNPIEDSFQK
ncbi:MAG: DUF1460 domain-containing protein [Culturomica sp.]|jgi:hypothetical protein|nr:DUF1460 domain-containing protein [Culturomica sp.]